MQKPSIPADEAARLRALQDLDILDTDPEERFERLTRLARHMFDTPIALVSLVDAERQWFKSRQGLELHETARDISFCGHTINADEILHVGDAAADPRFADNPLVCDGPRIRFYAGAPLANPKGHRLGTLCVIDTRPREFSREQSQALRDLADCVQAELNQAHLQATAHALKEQETYLRTVLDTVIDGVIVIDEQGIIQNINNATSELFGYGPEELLGHNVSVLMPQPHACRHDRYIENYLSSGKATIIDTDREVMARRRDGSIFPVQLAITEMDLGGKRFFVGAAQDIERSKQIEDSYQKVKDRLEYFISASPGVIFACKASGNYDATFVSANVGEVAGFTPEQFLQDSGFWAQRLHPQDREMVFKTLEGLQHHDRVTLEYRFQHANGEYRWMHTRLHQMRDAQGVPKELVGLWMDISAQRQMQDKAARNHQLLDAISQAQSQFIADSNAQTVFEKLLAELLQLTDSEYGFIGEVLYTPAGAPYLKTQAITDISWNQATRDFYRRNAPQGLEFYNLETLFGHALRTGETVIANSPCSDERRGGLPEGHPPLNAFLGQPFYLGDNFVGMVGIANRPGGYDMELVEFLKPMLQTCAQFIDALRTEADRRHTTEQLNRFKRTLDNTLDMIFMFDAETLEFEYLNRGAVESMGYSREQLLNMKPYDIKPDLDEASFRALIQPLLEGQQSVLEFETWHQHKDGSCFPVEVFMQLVWEASGRGRFVAIVRDITERKRIETEARNYANALERLHLITTASGWSVDQKISALLELGRTVFELPMGIVSRITDGRYTVEYSSAPQDAPPPGSCFELGETYCVHTLQSDKPTGFHHTGRSQIAGHPCYEKFRLEAYIGTPLYLGDRVYGTLNFSGSEPRAHPFSEQQFSLVRLLAQWIGYELEQDRMTRELLEVTAYRQAILDSANFSIISTDTEGLIKTFNQGAQEMLGYEEHEVIERATPAIIHDPEEIAKRAALLSEELAQEIGPGFEVFVAKARRGIPDENEWTYIRKDGTRIPVLLSVTALRDDSGRITGFLGIAADITERKKVERMKNEFVSTVSHELRTPLTSIRGALSVVLSKARGELSTKVLNMLETASRNSERLTLLINDILDLEKIESGRLHFDFAPVDLVEVAQSALAANESYAEHHQVRLLLEEAPQAAWILGDGHRLQQVFANLLSNAVKFAPQGSDVRISIEARNRRFRVRISDQGRGIPVEFHSRIFQRFAQADSSDSRNKGGTGLGLSICKAIVERHGGVIDFDRRQAPGTTFYFDIPAAAGEEHAAGAQNADILIVEDHAQSATVLRQLLHSKGHRAHVAGSLSEARRRLRTGHAYRVCLVEVGLDDGSGLDILKETDPSRPMAFVVISDMDVALQQAAGSPVSASPVSAGPDEPVWREQLATVLRSIAATSPRPRILHIEDDADIVRVMRPVVEEIGEYIFAPTLTEAKRIASQERVDLVFLDLELADVNGAELCDTLARRAPVVLFTDTGVPGAIVELVSALATKPGDNRQNFRNSLRKAMR